MNWKRTLWILWPANFAVVAGMSLVIPFLPLYLEKLGVSQLADIERWSGWVFAAQFVTSFLTQPLWGAMADRYGRKVMLLRAGFGMGIVTALMGLVGAPTLGRLGDKIGQRKILIFSLVIAALAFIPQALARSMTVLLIGRFLLGLFVGGMIPSLNVLVKKHAITDSKGTAKNRGSNNWWHMVN